jgi:hypothetical protein
MVQNIRVSRVTVLWLSNMTARHQDGYIGLDVDGGAYAVVNSSCVGG